MEDAGGSDPLEAGLKDPGKATLRLTLGVPVLGRPFNVPRSSLRGSLVSPLKDGGTFLREAMDAVRELLCGFHGPLLLVVPPGNDPRSVGYRPTALPLSYGTNK